MIRVMLVDDHALVRMGFRMLLTDAGVNVVAEADSGEQACRDYPHFKPDVVVMDLSMPGMGGLEAVRRLLAQDPHSPAAFRANGAAVNHDGFHAAFSTQPGDDMFKPAPERLHIW
jgi:DNA-binding NarL/FixJ family response regulator